MLLSFYQLTNQDFACDQALHLGESREVTREQQAKGDTSAWGFAARLRILSRLASLAIKGELVHRLPSLKRTRPCDNTEGKMTSVCITFSLFFLFGSAESGIRGSQDEERFVIFSEKSDNK